MRTEKTGSGPPVIRNVSARIAALERRAEYLENRLQGGQTRSETAANFERAELAGVRAGIRALRWHRSEVEGLDDVVAALEELMTAIDLRSKACGETPSNGGCEAADRRYREAMARARRVLQEWQ